MDSRKHSILQLTPKYFPSKGGVETHVKSVSEELIQQGFSVTIITVQHDKKLELETVINEVKVLRIPYDAINNKLKTWLWIWQHHKLFFNNLIQVHDVNWWLVPVFPFVVKKYFCTFHGWEGIFPIPFMNKLQRLFFAAFAKKTIHVGEYIQNFYFDKPTKITYGAISKELEKYEYACSKIDKSLNIVFLGRLESENDIEMYIDLLDQLTIKGIAYKMIWVGDGRLQNKCKKYGIVTGMVDDPINYLKVADIVFAASYLSILQAQAMGKIVASLYSTELKQKYISLYPGSKYLLHTKSIAEMINKIENLATDLRQLKKLSESAYTFAQQQTWKSVTSMYQSLWTLNTFRQS